MGTSSNAVMLSHSRVTFGEDRQVKLAGWRFR